MNILALDLGTNSGAAILHDGEIIIGTKKLRHDRNASGMRFLDFRNWLLGILEAYNIYMVFFERVYAHKGTCAAHVYGGFMYMLAAVCEEKQIKCVGIPVGTIKKIATGNGHASKEDMMDFAKRCGFNPVDDNSADALAILLTGLKLLKILRNNRYCLTNGQNGTAPPEASLAPELFRKLTPTDFKHKTGNKNANKNLKNQ